MGVAVRPGGLVKPLALLVAPPVYDFALYDLFLKPYALLRLGRWLETCGYRVRLVNGLDYRDADSEAALGVPRREARGTGKFFRQPLPLPLKSFTDLQRGFARYGILAESLKRRIAEQTPDLVLVGSGMTYWYPGVIEAVRLVRACYPRVPLVLGGVYATLCASHARRHVDADYLVEGAAFPRLAEILGSLSLPAPGGPPGEELLLSPEARWDAGVLRLNRGCPFRCAYCSSRLLEGQFQAGSPARTLTSLEEMQRRFATFSFAFYDDALLVGKERGLAPFLEQILAAGIRAAFYLPNAVHLSFLDLDTALLMKQAGFREIRIGFESSESGFHTTLDRKLNPAALGEGLALLRAAGFSGQQIAVYVLAGLPGQRKEEVEASIRFAAARGVRVSVAEYSPLPGSGLWERSVRLSSFPLEEEPLTHNNTVLPMRWRGFTLQDLGELKVLARRLSRQAGGAPPRGGGQSVSL
jgi:radical SAM superfamily enzyme YgiQ (UPF0313 family)